MIIGMHRSTGKTLSGMAHLRQSVGDILATPIGSRVMLRDYGSRLPDLVDRPINGAFKLDVYQAVVEALNQWEPRFVIDRVRLSAGSSLGSIVLDLYGSYNNQRVKLEGVTV